VSAWLLRAYPATWRERYGDELASLIEAESDGRRVALRVKVDVIAAGSAQRLRSSGLAGDEVPSERRIRAGVLLVLSSWAAFVVAGLGFAKSAEHWQAITPQPDHGVPAGAYVGVLLAATLGTLAVLLGIALTARPLVAFLRAGGWHQIHRSVLRALGSTGLTVVVLVGVAAWGHHLTNGQRNGGDLLYGAAFLALALCCVASIGLWTRAAVVTASKLALTGEALRRETFLAATTAVSMAVATGSATIWWTSVYGAPPRMVAMTLVMFAATTLAAMGSFRSVRALRA
jgi:hypothetical protein